MQEPARKLVAAVGAKALEGLGYAGGIALLLGSTLRWTSRGPRRDQLAAQMVRVGVRSLGVVVLVQIFIGVILALQMTPPLERYNSQAQVAIIIGLSAFRMLGPIITAVVLSGFAGASIAAELGTMVVAEEIEALQATAINPIRYLVVPRVLATLIMMLVLTAIGDLMIVLGGYLTSYLVLGPSSYVGYWQRIQDHLVCGDFVTGMIQASVFGLLIALIACYQGLRVTGGAEGVGRATTMTVVHSIVAIVAASCIFTAIFYVYHF